MQSSRLLTVLGGRRPYADTFGALSPRLVAVAGTLAVNGGALRGATAGRWGQELVVNGGMEAGNPPTGGTTIGGSTLSAVADERTGGAGSQCLAIARGTGNFVAAWATTFGLTWPTVGASGILSAWVKVIDAASVNCGVYRNSGTPLFALVSTPAQAWTRIEVSGQFAYDDPRILMSVSGTAGQAGRFDDVSLYRQNTAFLIAGWGTPHYVYTLDHISPASGVVPCSVVVRYTDPLNYWEVRLLPNTAGNDLALYQVTNGVEVPRADAKVDWTSNDIDQLRVVVEGVVIGLEHRKKGAGSWTDSASWSAATQGLNSPQVGGLLWGVNVNRIAGITLEAR